MQYCIIVAVRYLVLVDKKDPGIVHRLNKNTSGLAVIAKNDLAHNNLSRQFMDHGKNGDLEKFDALVWGVPKMSSGKIEAKNLRETINDKTKMILARNSKKWEALQ